MKQNQCFHNIRPLQLTHIQIYPTNLMPRDACVCLFCFFSSSSLVLFCMILSKFPQRITLQSDTTWLQVETSDALLSFCFQTALGILTVSELPHSLYAVEEVPEITQPVLPTFYPLHMCIFDADFNQWSGWRMCNPLLHIFHHLNHLVITTLTHRHSFSQKSNTSACTT